VLTAPYSGHQVMINGPAICPAFSFVRGCDPCPPGTAVGSARSEVRTNDLDAGGQWNCLETATTAVTECG